MNSLHLMVAPIPLQEYYWFGEDDRHRCPSRLCTERYSGTEHHRCVLELHPSIDATTVNVYYCECTQGRCIDQPYHYFLRERRDYNSTCNNCDNGRHPTFSGVIG